MKPKIKTLTKLALVASIIGLFLSAQSVSAAVDCRKARGYLSIVNNGNGTTSETVTQGGRLNGTARAVFTSMFTPTPDPFTFSFSDDFTLTTSKGVLTTHSVGIYDTVAGLISVIARVDPNAGAGEFDGATGTLYINGKTTDGGATFNADITGEICSEN
jgi:hypothetical protein